MSFVARAIVILIALAVIVGRSQTFSVQASFETGNPPKRVPVRSQNGAATPAGGPVETSWTPVGCLWSLWGCLGLPRGNPGDAPGRSEGPVGSVLRCSRHFWRPFSSSASKKHFFLFLKIELPPAREHGFRGRETFTMRPEASFLRLFSSSESSKVSFFERQSLRKWLPSNYLEL